MSEFKKYIYYDEFNKLDEVQKRKCFLLMSQCFMICFKHFSDALIKALKKE